MAYSETLAQEVRKLLAQKLPPEVLAAELEEKKMFGGLAFMIRGKMAVCIGDEAGAEVMVVIGQDLQQQAMPRTGAKTTVMRGRPYRGYIDLDHEGQKELSYWLDLALEYNRTQAGKH
ncbi:Uncharacterised protein [Kingella potus]|uniref:Uncharacterized protein n=1 Tax=Kingella potus TaxID=265175 RepID=A0A377R1P8_9NEIS|nr:TfoX/Sxy family protein [Kingella potus]UOP00140.1 TfoX/Sxy family protein [Kingella potus]STR02800.1 Uncharacterised protein [Kingella potus]